MAEFRALKRRDVGAQMSKKEGEEEEEGNADLGKIVNLMQWVSPGLLPHAPA